ncbi:hypothetical protein, partial [Paracoccus sp. (in: a-proteobacteria)]|uniref:hypothetical protein n=1 Tax=Paracoccus sp. TaxID=267 RepID=UPI003A849070
MASYVSGQSPLQSALSQLGAAPERDHPVSVQEAFDGIARRSNVPANVLIALDEANGGGGSVEAATKNAMALAGAVQGGLRIEDAITRLAGDEARGRAILERSYDIADQLYPAGSAPVRVSDGDGRVSAGEAAGGLARDAGTGAVRSIGSALHGLGVAADEIARFGDEPGK